MVLDSLRFDQPWWLLAVLVLLLAGLIKNWLGYRQARVILPISGYLRQVKINQRSHGYLLVPLCRILGLGLIIVALAQPQWVRQHITEAVVSRDFMLVLDLSNSMRAYDMQPTRLEAAKKVLTEFVGQRRHDRIGLVGFSGKSMTLMPLTYDHQALLKTLDQVNTGVIPVDGTAIGNALLTAANRLLQGHGEQPTAASPGVIILATDGINNQGTSPMAAAEVLVEKNIRLYAIGLGGNKPVLRYRRQRDGNLVPRRDVFGNRQYWSRPDFDRLRQLAALTRGRFFNAGSNEEFMAVMREIDQLEKPEVSIRRQQHEQPLFMLPLAVAMGLLIVERLLSRLRYIDYT